MDVGLDPELLCGALRLVVLPRADLVVARVLARAAVGDADDADRVAAVGVGGEDEDVHPSTAPTTRSAAVSTSSSTSAPSPQATKTSVSPRETTVTGGAVSSSAAGRACQTTTRSSPAY